MWGLLELVNQIQHVPGLSLVGFVQRGLNGLSPFTFSFIPVQQRGQSLLPRRAGVRFDVGMLGVSCLRAGSMDSAKPCKARAWKGWGRGNSC